VDLVAGTRMSPFWILLNQDDEGGSDNWRYNVHHQQTNIQFFTGRMPFLSPNHTRNSAIAEKLCYAFVQYATWCVLSPNTQHPHYPLPCQIWSFYIEGCKHK